MRTTRDLAAYVHAATIDDIALKVRERAIDLSLSSLGSALKGAGLAVSRLLADYARGDSSRSEAQVIGADFRASAEWAAALNCTSSHCTELEDVAWPDATYTCFLIPTVFSLADALQAPGRKILEALVLGYEVTSRPGITLTDGGAMKRGWLTCSAMGTVGAAAAAAKLLALSADQTLNAIAIAASLGAGLNRQTGSGAHVVEAGFAGRNGVMAARLAARGLTGNPTILEGYAGFWDALAGAPELDFELGRGEAYRVMAVGMKKYPCCYLSQRIIDGLLALRAEHGLTLDAVDRVEIGVNRIFPQILKYPDPANAEEARFSLPHIVVSALSGEPMFIETFTDAKVVDPTLAAARDKVVMRVHPEWGDAQLGERNTIAILLKDGRTLTRDCRMARGDPSDPLGRDELRTRFLNCADQVIHPHAATKAADLLEGLERLTDASQLMTLLASA
jgi:2-methylcitrate dehydratase PrpD